MLLSTRKSPIDDNVLGILECMPANAWVKYRQIQKNPGCTRVYTQ